MDDQRDQRPRVCPGDGAGSVVAGAIRRASASGLSVMKSIGGGPKRALSTTTDNEPPTKLVPARDGPEEFGDAGFFYDDDGKPDYFPAGPVETLTFSSRRMCLHNSHGHESAWVNSAEAWVGKHGSGVRDLRIEVGSIAVGQEWVYGPFAGLKNLVSLDVDTDVLVGEGAIAAIIESNKSTLEVVRVNVRGGGRCGDGSIVDAVAECAALKDVCLCGLVVRDPVGLLSSKQFESVVLRDFLPSGQQTAMDVVMWLLDGGFRAFTKKNLHMWDDGFLELDGIEAFDDDYELAKEMLGAEGKGSFSFPRDTIRKLIGDAKRLTKTEDIINEGAKFRQEQAHLAALVDVTVEELMGMVGG